MFEKIRIRVKALKPIHKNDIFLIQQENDKEYVQKHMQSQVRYKQFPHLHTEIIQTVMVEKTNIYLACKSMSEIDKNAKIFKLNMVENVHLKNIIIDSDTSSKSYKNIYKNIDENRFIYGMKLKYASACSLSNIKILNSGSNPLTFERCYLCIGEKNHIDGAINKGKWEWVSSFQ
jgi:hypothetical protein